MDFFLGELIERLWPDRFLVSITEPPPAWNVAMRLTNYRFEDASHGLKRSPVR